MAAPLFGFPDGGAQNTANQALASIITTFLGLTDTPNSYSGQTLKFVRVNAGETALEFASVTQTFVGLTDGPGSFSGQALKGVRVNAGETALQYVSLVTAFTQLSDVPASYSGQAGKVLLVNAAANAIEFGDTTFSAFASLIPRMVVLFLPGNATISQTGAGGLTNNITTLTTPTPTTTSLLTSFFSAQIQTAAGAGSSSGTRCQNVVVSRGSAAGQGGFRFVGRFGTTTSAANQRAFMGVTPAANLGNANPSTLTDFFGVGYDSGDTQLSIFYNDGAGSATKDSINGGTGFPVDSSSVYDIVFSCTPNDTKISYTVTNLGTGTTETGTKTSNLPTNTVWYVPQIWVNNGTTASAAQIRLIRMYLELLS